MNTPEYLMLFDHSGSISVNVKLKDFSGSVSKLALYPSELKRIVNEDGSGFVNRMTFDGYLFEIYKYEINPIKNTITIYARSPKNQINT